MTTRRAVPHPMRDNGQVPNNPFPEIPVTVPQIIRQVGHRTYQRGAAYQRNREVVRYSYDEDNRTLTGLVNGSTLVPYEVTIRFFPPRAGSAAFAARCTCPVVSNCKHAVALMLTALDRASVAKKALSEHPGPVGVPGAVTKATAAKVATDAKGFAGSKSADVAEAKKSADPLAALRASGALTTAAKLPAPDAAAVEPENPQGSFALNELGASPSLQAEAPASKISAWRKNLSSVLSARQDLSGIDSLRVSGALDLSMSVSGSYARGRNMPGATPAINLLARPLMRSKTGRWVKGGLTWDTFASSVGGPVGRHDIYPEHERFFAELYSIARPWQNMYSSHRDWISLSAAGSALLWDVLARAEEIGLPLLINGREVEYAILPPARVRLRAAALPEDSEENPDGGLLLEAALSWEGREGELLRQLWLPAAHCHPMGTPRTGFFALGGLAQQEYEHAAKAVHWKTTRPGALDEVGRGAFVQSEQTAQPEQAAVPNLPEGVELALIPLVEPLDAASEALISAGTVKIPAAERPAFQRDFLPALSRSVPALTPDPALALPSVTPPRLVLELTFDEEVRHDAQLGWHWEYPLNPFEADPEHESGVQRLPAFGYPGEEGGEVRDERFEARVLRSVRSVLAAHPALASLEERRVEGWETRELLSAILPKLRRISAVRVRFNGTPPEFVEATDALIEVTVTEGNSRDWFGLGIAVKVNNWTVPFAQIFEALDRGADRILLGNGTYFSLRRPEFKTLRTLIAEARELDEAGGELRINRHQAGLFSELESLAASVQTTRRWDEQVRSLLALVEASEARETDPADGANKPAASPDTHDKRNNGGVVRPNLNREYPVPAGLRATLRPYQVEGYRWLTFLYEHRMGGILADDMGLGKTVQALALLAHAIEEHRAAAPVEPFAPFLVVAPTSVITNWAAEAERFLPEAKVVTITETTAGKTPLAERVAGAHLVLTSYTLLRMDEEAYTGYARTLGRTVDDSTGEQSAPEGWGALLLDEAQFVKNTGTRAWSIARAMPARTKIAMTGTPLENNLMELWALLAIVADGLFPSARAFRDLYARPAESGEDPAHAAATTARLRRRIRPLMLRRTKELVAAELPAKNDVRVNLPLAPGHRRIYDTHLQRERQKVLGLLEDMDKNRFTIFQSLTLLRRLALDAALIDPEAYAGVSSVKRDYLVQQLPDLLEKGHRVLVFSQFTGYLKSISARLAEEGIGHLYLDGSTRNRAEVIEAFTSGQEPVFLISLKAGGFGLNLTEADHVFIMDPWWNPAAEQQAVDRIHRIGQDKEVHVYRLVAEGTIEEKVMQLKESKAALFDAVVGEGEFASAAVTAEDVRELFAPAVER
ncbi:MAG: SWIM zinc finger family protein [Rothia sp.]|uniref:DEAD/DEAH box helicase n=1 Tax=Rothia sp. (in: high G+C Gram-positive bacteria) TaxID=1885016 RepID=UPI001CAC7044|nr:SNF2-related protein [Rothia sp. (in: high G+C Gram-positive bacteria)]MBF1676890.1 SWIM zinc finger family protein [Rothia sp. (in: high G+C Gram-positive bacteria)]